ncbi:MAG: hypothetical protein QME77_12590 [bacterium]|nr:hypothetical protein [bacterium]
MPSAGAPSAKKRTFYLHTDVLGAIEALVLAGCAPSQNALIEHLVRRSLGRLLREQREVELRMAYAAAMQDDQYRATQEAVERDFDALDRETWGTAV